MIETRLIPRAVASDGAADPAALRAEGWCWSHPQPQGQHQRPVRDGAGQHLGSGQRRRHPALRRHRLERRAQPTSAALFGIHGSGPSDIWAVGGGGGTTLHYDGSAWTAVPNPSMQALRAVWSVAPTSAWQLVRWARFCATRARPGRTSATRRCARCTASGQPVPTMSLWPAIWVQDAGEPALGTRRSPRHLSIQPR